MRFTLNTLAIKGCVRKDCENVGCTRYSKHFGHVCDECFEDVVHFVRDGQQSTTGALLIPKGTPRPGPNKVRDYLDKYFARQE